MKEIFINSYQTLTEDRVLRLKLSRIKSVRGGLPKEHFLSCTLTAKIWNLKSSFHRDELNRIKIYRFFLLSYSPFFIKIAIVVDITTI